MGKEKTNKELLTLQGMVNMYKIDNEQMAHDILSLKHKIGGYTSYTSRLKKELETWKGHSDFFRNQRDEAYKTFRELSGDYTKQLTKNDQLKKQCDTQEKIIKECRNELANIQKEYELLEEQYASVSRDKKVLSDVYYGLEDYLAKPWYKRIFIKLDKLLEDAD